MKTVITILVLIIIGALVYWICNVRAHAVEHYACTGQAATGLVIDYPNAMATITGGPHAGAYKGVAVTTDEVVWQTQDEFTFNRHSGRFTVMKNAQNVVSLTTAECQPKSLYDRFVTMVH